MAADLRRGAERIAAKEGHRVLRPVGADSATRFPLTYIRSGPRRSTPVVFVPGGPGLASAVPYRRIRALAERDGLDVIMMEHRGIGLSRRDEHGDDLPVDAVTVDGVVDDLAAVLDHAGVSRAVIYGSSYGTYIAQGFGVRYPDRVAAMVLDSPMLAVESDLAVIRHHRRELFLGRESPERASLVEVVRAAVDSDLPDDEVGQIVQIVYEFAGPGVLETLLSERLRGRLRRTWSYVAGLGRAEVGGPGVPYYMEPDLVENITYRELGMGLPVDGRPLDPQTLFAHTGQHPDYAGEPFDFRSLIKDFVFPTVVISGERDLRTPRPVAATIAALVPNGALIPVEGMGHSALDTHHLVAVRVANMLADNAFGSIPAMIPVLSQLPRHGMANTAGPLIAAAVALGRRDTGPRALLARKNSAHPL